MERSQSSVGIWRCFKIYKYNKAWKYVLHRLNIEMSVMNLNCYNSGKCTSYSINIIGQLLCFLYSCYLGSLATPPISPNQTFRPAENLHLFNWKDVLFLHLVCLQLGQGKSYLDGISVVLFIMLPRFFFMIYENSWKHNNETQGENHDMHIFCLSHC